MEKYKVLGNRSGRQIILKLNSDKIRICMECGVQRYNFDRITGPNLLIKLGSWLVERAQDTIGFRLTESIGDWTDSDKEKLILEFFGEEWEEIITETTLSFFDNDDHYRRQREVTRQIQSIILNGNTLQLLYPEDMDSINDMNMESGAENSSGQVLDREAYQGAEASEYETNLIEIIRRLEDRNKELSSENDVLRTNIDISGQLSKGNADLEIIKKETKSTDAQLKHVRQELRIERSNCAEIKEELHKAIEEKESVEAEIADIENKQKETDEILSELRKELNILHERDEIKRLDIDRVREEILEIRERITDDSLTLMTMEEDVMIGTGSVKEILRKAGDELEKAENKICQITKRREMINNQVHDAVTGKGSCFLSAAGEVGGE